MGRYRILVVEDDRSVRQMYRAALVMAGFEVSLAADGMAALRMLDEERPDLVVLDLHLPRVDGLSVLSEIRANSHTSDVPVVVVTGVSYQHAVTQASALLEKPCDPSDLLAAVRIQLAMPAASPRPA